MAILNIKMEETEIPKNVEQTVISEGVSPDDSPEVSKQNISDFIK